MELVFSLDIVFSVGYVTLDSKELPEWFSDFVMPVIMQSPKGFTPLRRAELSNIIDHSKNKGKAITASIPVVGTGHSLESSKAKTINPLTTVFARAYQEYPCPKNNDVLIYMNRLWPSKSNQLWALQPLKTKDVYFKQQKSADSMPEISACSQVQDQHGNF